MTARIGGASSTPQNGVMGLKASTSGTRIDAHNGTRAIRFINQGCNTSWSITTMIA